MTADEYETPIAVADSARELGEMFGVTVDTVTVSAYRNVSGKLNGHKYVKVAVD